MREIQVQSLGRKDPLEKAMATHSSTLAWKIPWTEESGGLQSMGSQRVGHDWVTSLSFTRCNLFSECGFNPDFLLSHWVSFVIFLCLIFHTYKMGKIVIPTSWVYQNSAQHTELTKCDYDHFNYKQASPWTKMSGVERKWALRRLASMRPKRYIIQSLPLSSIPPTLVVFRLINLNSCSPFTFFASFGVLLEPFNPTKYLNLES